MVAIPDSVEFISEMPDTVENCAIWATIWVLSTGLNGSWFFSCAVISVMKSDWSSEELVLLVVAVVVAVVPVRPMPRLDSVESKVLVVMISGHATIKDAVDATQLGAYDILEKPLDTDRILVLLRNALVIELGGEFRFFSREAHDHDGAAGKSQQRHGEKDGDQVETHIISSFSGLCFRGFRR